MQEACLSAYKVLKQACIFKTIYSVVKFSIKYIVLINNRKCFEKRIAKRSEKNILFEANRLLCRSSFSQNLYGSFSVPL